MDTESRPSVPEEMTTKMPEKMTTEETRRAEAAIRLSNEQQNEDPGPTHIVSAIRALIGKEVKLETKDGSARHGKLTAVPMDSIFIGYDTKFEWPRGVVLNGDKTDEIAWSQLAWINSAV